MSEVWVTILYINAQADNPWRQKLQNHLQQKYKGYIQHRYVQKIPPGSDREKEYEIYANEADILLLLISADLHEIEPKIRSILVRKHQSEELRIFPIYLRPVEWQDADFGKLTLIPLGEKAITEYLNKDSILKEIALEILAKVEELLKKKYKTLIEYYRSQGNYAQSLATCKQAILVAQEHDASLYELQGDLYIQSEHLQDALEAYNRALRLQAPPSPNLLEKKGEILFSLGSYEAALGTYKEALGYTAGSASLFYNLGQAYYELKQFEQARQAYQQALQYEPQNAQFLARVGDTFLVTPRAEESLSWYDRAIALQSTTSAFYEKKGHAFMRITNYKEALSAYEQAIAYDGEHANYFISKARALERLGTKYTDYSSLEKAVESYELALQMSPGDPYILKELGDVLVKLRKLAAALGAYEEAIRCKPDFALAYLGKGNVLHQQASNLEKLAQDAYNKAKYFEANDEDFS